MEFSAVAFSDTAEQIQAPTPDLTAFMDSVNEPRRFSGGTAMSVDLSTCFASLQGLTGNRIIVLVTYGVPNNVMAATTVGSEIRAEEDVFLVTMGIGVTVIGEQLLRDIAHTPDFAIIITDLAIYRTSWRRLFRRFVQ